MTLVSATQAYLRTPHFDGLALSTRRGYSRGLKRLESLGGDLLDVSRAQVVNILNALPHGERTVSLTAIRVFFNWAIEQGWLENNPAWNIRMPAKKGHTKQWTEAEAKALMSCGEPEVEVASALAYYTGQRMGDVLKMTWGDIEGDAIHVRQQKTGAELVVPLAPVLRQRLDLLGRAGDMDRIVPGQLGKPNIFRYRFKKASRKLGLDVHFHGARVACAGRLAEAGCSTREIMAVGGWKSSCMVDLYTAQASQEALARAAIGRMG